MLYPGLDLFQNSVNKFQQLNITPCKIASSHFFSFVYLNFFCKHSSAFATYTKGAFQLIAISLLA